MGVVGIHIHGLLNRDGKTAPKGKNPFDFIDYGNTGKSYLPSSNATLRASADNKERYAWIKEHLSNATEEAVRIRKDN